MFNFIRRISGSVIPRQDRPWREDATSNAPTIGRKRRLSSTDRDPEDQESEQATAKKKAKGPGEEAALTRDASPAQAVRETEEVRAVRRGVGEVELENPEDGVAQAQAGPLEGGLSSVAEEEGETRLGESSERTKTEDDDFAVEGEGEKDPALVPLPVDVDGVDEDTGDGNAAAADEADDDEEEEDENRSSSPDNATSPLTSPSVPNAPAGVESSLHDARESQREDAPAVSEAPSKKSKKSSAKGGALAI